MCWVYPHACGGTYFVPVRARSGPGACYTANAARRELLGIHNPGIPALGAIEVYPHACGGTKHKDAMTVWRSGLSPRLWGNRREGRSAAKSPGSIPTPVGELRTRTRIPTRAWVYPHACGGTPGRYHPTRYHGGLSPRLWGNPARARRAVDREGSIPTPVGEPAAGRGGRRHTRVYPHACGGTPEGNVHVFLTSGLSPRLWGNPRERGPATATPGSIPTPVGEPCWSWITASGKRVYPHACGGTGYDNRVVPAVRGLSPRLWGNH